MDNKKKRRRYMRMALFLLLMLPLAASPVGGQMASPNFQIPSSVLDIGGGLVSSANFGVRNSLGQPTPIGISQSSSFGLYAGFQPTSLEEFPQWIPAIRLSAVDLDFGEVRIGSSSNQVLTVYNDGYAPLEVSEISSDNLQFIASPETLSIGGMGSAGVVVTFAPTVEDTIEATLTLVCNDSDQPELQVPLYGVGIAGCPGGEPGDVNGDGGINVLDVLAVVNHILGIVLLDEDGQCRADCTGDGLINVLDALAIVNVILGIIPECPAGGGCKPVVTSETIAFLKSLKSYLSVEDFARFMALVKAQVQVPVEYSLSQNYPNPFNPTTDIRYQIPDVRYKMQDARSKIPIHTSLKIYNILGQEVITLVDEAKEAGYYTVAWDGRDSSGREVSSGIYFYRLKAGDFTATKKMALLK